MLAFLIIISAWHPVSTDGAVSIERRPVLANGRELFELRASAPTRCTPEQMGDTLWRHQDYTQFVPHLKRLDVLSVEGNTKILYQQATMPVVKDRDYILKVVRSWDAANQVYESVFETKNDTGPPPSEAYVRLTLIRGKWTISPGEVVYQIVTDPGPSVPIWVQQMAQKGAIIDLVKAMIKRCESTH